MRNDKTDKLAANTKRREIPALFLLLCRRISRFGSEMICFRIA